MKLAKLQRSINEQMKDELRERCGWNLPAKLHYRFSIFELLVIILAVNIRTVTKVKYANRVKHSIPSVPSAERRLLQAVMCNVLSTHCCKLLKRRAEAPYMLRGYIVSYNCNYQNVAVHVSYTYYTNSSKIGDVASCNTGSCIVTKRSEEIVN